MKKVHKIPFFSQHSEDDWQERGFFNKEDAIYWQDKACGIACVKMVLDMHTEHSGQKFADLINEMEEKGVYLDGKGCVHQGIAGELNNRSIDAQRMKIETVDQIKKFIDQDNIFIASIGSRFLNGKKSGHLIPVIGYTEENGKVESIIVHYTSTPAEYQLPERDVDSTRFMNHFSGNVIRVRLYDTI